MVGGEVFITEQEAPDATLHFCVGQQPLPNSISLIQLLFPWNPKQTMLHLICKCLNQKYFNDLFLWYINSFPSPWQMRIREVSGASASVPSAISDWYCVVEQLPESCFTKVGKCRQICEPISERTSKSFKLSSVWEALLPGAVSQSLPQHGFPPLLHSSLQYSPCKVCLPISYLLCFLCNSKLHFLPRSFSLPLSLSEKGRSLSAK